MPLSSGHCSISTSPTKMLGRPRAPLTAFWMRSGKCSRESAAVTPSLAHDAFIAIHAQLNICPDPRLALGCKHGGREVDVQKGIGRVPRAGFSEKDRVD